MSDAPRIAYRTVLGTTAEVELSALAVVYRRAMERYEEVKAAERSGGEDARKEDEHVSGKIILP